MPFSGFTPLDRCPWCGADAWSHLQSGYDACRQCRYRRKSDPTPTDVNELLGWCNEQLKLLPAYMERKGLTPSSVDAACHRVLRSAYEFSTTMGLHEIAVELGPTPFDPTLRCGEVITKLHALRQYCREKVGEELTHVKITGYRPSSEISRIIFELSDPPSNLPPKPNEPIEIPNLFDDARRPWLPILKEYINKVPELAGSLTEEKLRAWLWREHKVAPTTDLYAEQLVSLFELETGKCHANQTSEFIKRLLAGPDDVELSPRELALLEAHLRQPVSHATIQKEMKAGGHSPTESARNKLKLIRDFNRGLPGQSDADEAEKREAPAPAIVQTETTPAATLDNDPALALIRVFTDGISDDRIVKATRLLADDKLTVNEKLTEIDALIRFPGNASAEHLGEMLGVTKQAVLKTDWWIQKRKGEKQSEVGRRQEGHRKRSKNYEAPG